MITTHDMTLDELRAALGPLLPGEAAFDGWTDQALTAAARTLGVSPEQARLAIGEGSIAMIDAWFQSVDAAMEAQFTPDQLAGLRIRQRIFALIVARVDLVAPHREALRRALAILALPTNGHRATKLAWRAADRMWRLAGDRSTGPAHYTKRLTLGGVYASTLLALLQDESDDLTETKAFLGRRIDNIMQFEQLKARFRHNPEYRFNVTRFLGRLRYPAR